MILSRILFVLALAVIPLTDTSAKSAAPSTTLAAPEEVSAPEAGVKIPDLMAFGVGWFDVRNLRHRRQAADFRVEYRSGMSLLSSIYSGFANWDQTFQLHPMAGIEATSRGQFYAFGGLVFDVLLTRNLVFSPTFAAGAYSRGPTGKNLGSGTEFRTTGELGWRFDDESRVTAFFGHISNAGIGTTNHGAEMAGIYYQIPMGILFGKK